MLGFGLGYVYRDRVAATAGKRPQLPRHPVGTAPDDPAGADDRQDSGTGNRCRCTPPRSRWKRQPALRRRLFSSPKPRRPQSSRRKVVPSDGRVVVTSNPAKAGVIPVNGKWSGRTPLTLDDVKFGSTLRVVQPGYEVVARAVRVVTVSGDEERRAALAVPRRFALPCGRPATAPNAAASEAKPAQPASDPPRLARASW